MRRLRLAAVLAACAIGLVPAGADAAIERVTDGGFEAAACNASECTDPAWTPSVTTAFANATGPICRAGTGSGTTACAGDGSGPFNGGTWARLGAGYKASAMFGGGVISSLEQTVAVPNGPATLSFRLRIINVAGPIGQFEVEAGGSQVFSATDATPGFADYSPVSIDVRALAGTTPVIRFDGISSQDPVGPLDSFDVDDISLTTEDPRCATLRAKLKKAKGKKNKKKRKKIRKKLRGLGC